MRFLFLLAMATCSAGASIIEENLIYESLEQVGIQVGGYTKATIQFLPEKEKISGWLVWADGETFLAPPRVFFQVQTLLTDTQSTRAEVQTAQYFGMGNQIKDILEYRRTTRTATANGPRVGILRELQLTLERVGPVGHGRFKIVFADGSYELVDRSREADSRTLLQRNTEFVHNPFRKKGLCARLCAKLSEYLERRQN